MVYSFTGHWERTNVPVILAAWFVYGFIKFWWKYTFLWNLRTATNLNKILLFTFQIRKVFYGCAINKIRLLLIALQDERDRMYYYIFNGDIAIK